MSHPHRPYDPELAARLAIDPGLAIDIAAEFDEAWEDGYAKAVDDQRWRVTALFLAALSGLVLGFLLATAVQAAPRSASDSTLGRAPGREPSGAPRAGMAIEDPRAEVTGEAAAPAAGVGAPTAELGTAMVAGRASYVRPGLGARYLALPDGPGIRVRICARETGRCLDRTSTDAGPDRSMQRAGRVADLSFADFRTLCGCAPATRGTIPVTVEYGAPQITPPPTSTQP